MQKMIGRNVFQILNPMRDQPGVDSSIINKLIQKMKTEKASGLLGDTVKMIRIPGGVGYSLVTHKVNLP